MVIFLLEEAPAAKKVPVTVQDLGIGYTYNWTELLKLVIMVSRANIVINLRMILICHFFAYT